MTRASRRGLLLAGLLLVIPLAAFLVIWGLRRGEAPDSPDFDDPQENSPVHILEPGRIIGRVVDGVSAEPVEGVTVCCRGGETLSERGGRFRFTGLSPGRVLLSAAKKGYGSSESRAFELGADAGLDAGDLVLLPIPVLRGTVLDGAGSPIANPRVCCMADQRYRLVPRIDFYAYTRLLISRPVVYSSIHAGTSGRFEVFQRDVGDRPFYLWAAAPGYGARGRSFPAGTNLKEDVTLRLGPAEKIAGRVRLSDGRAAQGTEVMAVSESNVAWGMAREIPLVKEWVSTDSHGRFSFPRLSHGTYSLLIQHPSFPVHAIYHVESGTPHLVVNLEKGFLFKGRILAGPKGPAVEGARITVDGLSSFGTCVSGRDGRFVLGRLKGPDLRILVQAEGYPLNSIQLPDLRGGGDEFSMDLVLTEGREVKGRVFSMPEGKPLPQAVVRLVDDSIYPMIVYEALSGLDGSFTLEGVSLPVREHCIEFSLIAAKAGFLTRELRHQENVVKTRDETRFSLYLRRAVSASGRVTDRRGRPVVQAVVDPEYADKFLITSYAEGEIPSARTDEGGWFHLSGLPPDRDVRLVVHAAGYAPVISTAFRLEAGSHLPERNFVLGRGSSISGRALGEEGGTLSGAVVELAWQGEIHNPRLFDLFFQRAVTDRKGRFSFSRLPPGEWLLDGGMRGRSSATEEIDLEAGEDGEAELVLSPSSEIGGMVVSPAGDGVHGVTVEARRGGRKLKDTLTALDGSFLLHGLTGGPYRLLFRKSGYHIEWLESVETGEVDLAVTMQQVK